MKHKCAHGVPKDEGKQCGLTQLVAIVNRLAGKPCAPKSEAALRRFAAADRASNPLNQLEFRLGHSIKVVRVKKGKDLAPVPMDEKARKIAEGILREAEIRANQPQKLDPKPRKKKA